MKQVLELLEPMFQNTRSCFLIGSQMRGEKTLDKTRDIDLVFIVDRDEDRNEAAALMQTIQRGSEFLFHPTIVSDRQFTENPTFEKLVRNGLKVW